VGASDGVLFGGFVSLHNNVAVPAVTQWPLLDRTAFFNNAHILHGDFCVISTLPSDICYRLSKPI
jgi:hypothetical protein